MKNVLLSECSDSCINNFRNFPKKRLSNTVSKQMLRIMKLTTIFILVAIMQVSANGYSQNVTLNETNSNLDKVFTEIRKQTGYDFLYNTRLLRNTVPVTVKAKNSSLEEVLEQVFKNQPLTYTITENTIILKRRDERLMEQVSKFSFANSSRDVTNISSAQTSGLVSNFNIEQQRVDIRGKVIDATGEALIGVSVRVKGSETGASTDVNGSFSLSAPENAILVFTYIGYVTQEVAVNGRTSVNVTMVEDRQALSEVVVTAFGVTKAKRGLGYGVQEIPGESLTESRQNNIANSLTGKIAGVDATQANSGAGGSSRVIIRGNTSLNGNQQPLYVVDGMPINNGNRGPATSSSGFNADRGDGISSMNPDDIATISVLKGGAAAALYGSQAANGVILITTKKGSAQKGVGIEVTSDANFGNPSVFPNYQYVYGQGNDGVKPATAAAALSSGRLSYGAKMDGSLVMQFDGVMRAYSPYNVKDNIKNFYQTSQNITNTVAFNAGNQNLRMRLSVSDLRAKDQQPNSDYKRKTANLNVTGKMGKNDFLTIESSVQYNLVEGTNRPNVGYAEINSAWPVYLAANVVDVRNMRGTDPNRPGINVATGRELDWNPVPAAVNPYYAAYQIGNEDDRQRLIGRASVQANILPNLFVKGTVARDFNYYTESFYVPGTNSFTPLGYFQSAVEKTDKTNFQGIVNYNERFLTDKIGLNILAGVQSERDFNKSNTANGSQWVVPNFYSISNLVNRDLANSVQATLGPNPIGNSGTNSVFGEANIDYKNLFYLTVTGRQDWFSVLNPGFNSIFYPSVGASFIISEVVKMPKFIDYAKLRSSWAEVGSATVNAGSINQTYNVSTVNAYGLPTLTNPNTLNNPNIRPVTVETIEGGFEVQMLNNRIGLDVNYYSRKTRNDILSPPISGATGFAAGRRNLGLVTNKGWEISLTGTPVKLDDFSWDVNYNFGYNQSKIVELAPGIDILSLGSGIGGPQMINAVGLPYSTVRANVMKLDANGNKVYNTATGYEVQELRDLGVGNPPYLMGLGNNFRYKRFSLTIDIDSKFGAVGYSNLIQYATRFGLTPQTLPGREGGLTVSGVSAAGAPYTKVWNVVDLDTYYNNFGNAYPGMWVYKTDFIKLRRAVLKYNLPVSTLKFMKVQSASIGITGLNLAILYQDKKIKEAGIDPEMQETVGNAQGSQGVSMPRTRNIGFNLNLRF
ncbi:TonB-linked outer membrane protein, SusC/RagA family [Daejeonella rubra]|uniref:TonB-linked outer membrane protein, SusC/RagA family n=2 Tax=Daejeonella rubra TaxID=990371 RepID=A0A1G9SJD1_9SPHI|nr:TonB-linked outer membrane protein, SusC/RagA family [Daejeonella rubra]